MKNVGCTPWHWLRRWYSQWKLQKKFLAILLLALLLVFSGTLLTSRITYRAYDNSLYERTLQLLTLFAQNIQAGLENATTVSFNIVADNVLQTALTHMRQEAYGKTEWISAKRDADERLMNISLMRSDVLSIRLQALDGTEFSKNTFGKPVPSSLLSTAAEDAHAARGREIWVPDANNPGSLFLVRDVREIADLTLNSIGILAMRIDMQSIVNRCFVPLSQMGMPLACAIDLAGTRVYANRDELMDLPIRNNGYSLHDVNGERMFFVSYAPTGSDWAYLAALPYDSITRSISWASGISTAIAVAALAVSMALGSLLIGSILNHLKRLIKKYDAFAHGTLTFPIPDDPYRDSRDEIGELHRQFDRIAAEHQQMIQEIYVKQQLLLEAQVRQLRAQIQPHFLYNTLESIYCLAEKGGDESIATMTTALGRMLRATLNDKLDIITIGEDMEIAREYLSIQLIRYGDQLLADFQIADEFLAVPIPAMTIQPLVENAVRHGAEEMLEMCEIRVYCQRMGPFVDVAVEDNGPGMAEDILEKLESGEIKPEGLGIGLNNIHKRLQLAFNEECGLRIQRCEGKTRVIVRVLAEGKHHD
jgi:two-component system sensor histidine kinase YesM